MNRSSKPNKILAGLEHKKPTKHNSPQFDEAESGDDQSEEERPDEEDSNEADEEQSGSEESEVQQQKPGIPSKKQAAPKADPEVIKVPNSVHLTHNQSKHGVATQNAKKSSTPTKAVQKNKSIPKIESKKQTSSKEEPAKPRQDKEASQKHKPSVKAPKNIMTYEDPHGFDMGQDIISKLRSEFLDKKEEVPNLDRLEDELGLEEEEINHALKTQEDSDREEGLLFSSKKTPPPTSKSRYPKFDKELPQKPSKPLQWHRSTN